MSGYDFGEENEVVEGGFEEGFMQWLSQQDCEGAEGTTVGWHIQVGRYPYLDKVCAKANFPQVKIEQTSGTNAYWQIGNKTGASVFVLAKGSYSEVEMNDKTKRAGIAFGWNKDKDGKNIKTLKFRAHVAELLPFFDEENPPRPLVVVAKKQFASDLLPILGRDGQYRVLKANNEIFQEKHGKPTKTPYWGFSILLTPGKREKRMNKDRTVGSFVSPIASDIPAVIGAEYLEAHHVGEYLDLVKREIEDSVAWSRETTDAICAGANGDEEESGGIIEGSSNGSESYDHPFDDGPPIGPDGEYATMPVEFRSEGKPAAKPQPSNNLKPMSDAELDKIPGGAKMPQRRFIQNNLKRPDLAQKAGLSEESARKYIVELQRTQR